MFSSDPPYKSFVEPFFQPPPKGTPESVAVAGSEQPGRSKVYRHWKIGDGELLRTIDPNVRCLDLLPTPKSND